MKAMAVHVTAEYNPATYEVGKAIFISTTKCSTDTPNMTALFCNGSADTIGNIFFSQKITVHRNSQKDFSDKKNSFVFLGASGSKTMMITSELGKKYPVEFIPEILGVKLNAEVNMSDATPIYDSLLSPKGGCNYIQRYGHGSFGIDYWGVLWGGVLGRNCFLKESTDKNLVISDVFLGFKVKSPSPLNMQNGTYRGNIILSIGPHGDISLGNGEYSENNIKIYLTLTVRHQLKIEFPTGSHKISLQPLGGWDALISNRRGKKTILQQQLPFRVWGSAPFDVGLRCQYYLGKDCALRNKKDHQVAIKIYYGEHHSTPRLLSASNMQNINYLAGGDHIDEEAKLIFEIDGDTVDSMLDYSGATYLGDVTVIFDAAI